MSDMHNSKSGQNWTPSHTDSSWFVKTSHKIQKNIIKMGDHRRSESWIFRFTNFKTSVHIWHIHQLHIPTAETEHLLSNNSYTYTAQREHLPYNNSFTYTAQTWHLPHNNSFTYTAQTGHLPHNNSYTSTAQTGHLPSNKSSPRFSSEVPWWKYFPENPKLNRKPGTSCCIRCWVVKIACRH